ncbi:sensor histidine kinase [Microbacterium allomyrinae]|uniref:histidine kinase n=1 Tax=Microbacterium allomyrinae TaxID=2830666 RepID=A0A9X1S3X4_9MICO|nr:histidine kinase [Microbacterium allomyrinae]MCC2033644.1 sensor histidine kinase [Microbacterium allomyrinae]
MFRRLRLHQIVIDVVLAGAFFLVAAPVELITIAGTTSEAAVGVSGTQLASVVIVVLFSGALAVRRLSPALALGLAWAAALLQVGLGRPPSLADVAIFAVLYATAAYGSARVYWAGFGSALGGALVITVYLMAGPVFAGGGLSWQTLPLALVMLVAAVFALGLSWTVGALVRSAVRARENRAAQERAESEAAAEQERVRIARDMHDVVAHSLAVVIAQADGARYALAAAQTAGPASPADPALAATALGTISTTARSALADVRLLLTQLRHSQAAGPQPTIADLEGLYAQVRAAGVQLRVDVDPVPPGEPPAAVQLAVYRILQEALTNALRHGEAGRPVDVRLSWHPDRVDVSVRNPLPVAGPRHPAGAVQPEPRITTGEQSGQSQGGHPQGGAPQRGHGLIGMRERAQLVGGRLEAGAEPDAGTGGSFIVRATLPIGGLR